MPLALGLVLSTIHRFVIDNEWASIMLVGVFDLILNYYRIYSMTRSSCILFCCLWKVFLHFMTSILISPRTLILSLYLNNASSKLCIP